MHSVTYLFQLEQFVSYTSPDNIVRYGTIKQINIFIYADSENIIHKDVEYLIEIFGVEKCNTVTVEESRVSASPSPIV